MLVRAYELAAQAYGNRRRPTDLASVAGHAIEVGHLLEQAGSDERLVAAGLLHDAAESGTVSAEDLRLAVGDDVARLVLDLTEDPSIESYDERKVALRAQVRASGSRAIAVFAADKLSAIRGLHRGTELFGDTIEARTGATVDAIVGQYGESLEMIEAAEPDCPLLPALRIELASLLAALEGRAAPPRSRFVPRLDRPGWAPVSD